MSHWSSSSPLVHHRYWTLIKTCLGYPAATPSHGDPVGILPQDPLLHVLQQVIDGVAVRVRQPKVLEVGLGGS